MAGTTVVDTRWSKAEDDLLLQAVASFGEHENWKTVAQAVPGRTNKACRKRWLHSLSPSLKKCAWTPAEDQLLLELYTAHGPKWSAIARKISGRTDDACSKRYREALDPNLKKDEWTYEEDVKLAEAHARLGGKWGQVGQELRRSGLGCRNRWRMLERNRIKFTQHAQPPPPPVVSDETPVLEEPPQDGLVFPFFPPEDYPSLLNSEPGERETSFLEPPPMPDSPQVPPFNFSSSSLSAALSDPPRTSLPLPPVPEEDTFDPNQYHLEPEPTPDHSIPHDLRTIAPYELYLHRSAPQIEMCGGGSGKSVYSDFPSPLASSSSSSSLWQSPIVSTPESLPLPESSGPTFDHMDAFAPYDSSSSSSPFVPPPSLSPADSPIAGSPVELPPIETLPPDSLLFSSTYYRVAPSKRQRKPRPRKPPKSVGEMRISQLLPLSSDPNVRPYACGRESCWPSTSQIGYVCFATSKELLDHSRTVHGEASVRNGPFRCALVGCGKSWKTMNGLQYHLQISTAHFRHAVSSTFNSTEDSEPAGQDDSADHLEDDRRTYVCPEPQCFKAYRQASGLRYHRKHVSSTKRVYHALTRATQGHPRDMPAQLEMVPPTVAREIPKQTKKMRRKDVGVS
ncbi:hypothetical protein FB45DRAFT_915812 [Roridomyces roridus]|uniref:Uncharacterized protein n=1 Tax=Roridomyces roridus TaxID=1738132 RepID=A0AAD7FPC0_9AGAR|nr:hypothetical protein FB45DRAFT_915812 [Roridomyces roridus]